MTMFVTGCDRGSTIPASDTSASQGSVPASDLKYSSMEEWQGALVQCMHDVGWTNVVEAEANWGIEDNSLTMEQRGAFKESLADCESQVGVAPVDLPLTDDEIRLVYSHWIKQKECLEGLGYEISDPPSEDTFVAQAKAHKVGADWNPFAEVHVVDEDPNEVFRQCPQMPPGM